MFTFGTGLGCCCSGSQTLGDCSCLPREDLTLTYRIWIEPAPCPPPFDTYGKVCHGPTSAEYSIPLLYKSDSNTWVSDPVCVATYGTNVTCYDDFPNDPTSLSAFYGETLSTFTFSCIGSRISGSISHTRSHQAEFYSASGVSGPIKTVHCASGFFATPGGASLAILSCDPVDIYGSGVGGPGCPGPDGFSTWRVYQTYDIQQ